MAAGCVLLALCEAITGLKFENPTRPTIGRPERSWIKQTRKLLLVRLADEIEPLVTGFPSIEWSDETRYEWYSQANPNSESSSLDILYHRDMDGAE